MIIFADGEAKSPQNIHYMECQKLVEYPKYFYKWGKDNYGGC